MALKAEKEWTSFGNELVESSTTKLVVVGLTGSRNSDAARDFRGETGLSLNSYSRTRVPGYPGRKHSVSVLAHAAGGGCERPLTRVPGYPGYLAGHMPHLILTLLYMLRECARRFQTWAKISRTRTLFGAAAAKISV
eukprot:3933891-Rhodomonas_salina.1